MNQYNISDFDYQIDEDKIANEPLKNRSKSKLLVYKDNTIKEETFDFLPNHINTNDVVLLNTTKVIPARLYFQTETDAQIEILCLEPLSEGNKNSTWKVFIGNKKKWKEDVLLSLKKDNLILTAKLLTVIEDAYEIFFDWNQEMSFYEVLDVLGHVPLPPYIKREDHEFDKNNYQTIFAQESGSVAAPTASLHFDDEVLARIKRKGVQVCTLTLHVGAGTFKPMKSDCIEEHLMHREYFSIPFRTIEQCLIALKTKHKIFAVGTTALRSIESIALIANKLSEKIALINLERGFSYNDEEKKEWMQFFDVINVMQWERKNPSLDDTIGDLELLIDLMAWLDIKSLDGFTYLMITPGFKFQIANQLVTNFHQPKSTLLLLVSAFIGDKWKEIYNFALANNFRFFSYGDASLLSK